MRRRIAAILIIGLALPAAGTEINIFNDKEEKKQLRQAQYELKQLQKRIKRKDIPPIEFEFNKAVLRDHSKVTLDLVADLLFKFPKFKLFIAGHTCDIGSAEYNACLSQKRAEAVKDYLVEVGIMGEYIKAKGYGEEKPIADNDTEEGRIKNRRVEFYITTRIWHSVY